MLIEFRNIEPAGREAIIEGLKKTTVLRDLEAALTAGADATELDFSSLVDVEIKSAAGLFFGLSRSLDLKRFQKTFELSFILLQLLNAEFERRIGAVR